MSLQEVVHSALTEKTEVVEASVIPGGSDGTSHPIRMAGWCRAVTEFFLRQRGQSGLWADLITDGLVVREPPVNKPQASFV